MTSRRGPRLLASTGALPLSRVDWVLEAIADAGFDGAELVVTQGAGTRDPERVRAAAERAGLDIPVVHGPYMVVSRHVLGLDYITKTCRSLELTAAVGAGVLVAHAPWRMERRARQWLKDEVDFEAAEHGVLFAMENLFPVFGRHMSSVVTPDELAAFRHVVFDTSHFGAAGTDLLAAWEQLRAQVVHLHVSDNHGSGRDDHAPIGEGVLPLGALLGAVGRSDYTGTITLEVNCRQHLDSREQLVAFLAAQRAQAERLLAGQPRAEVDDPLQR
ncbi:MAG: sugar phosphate isomerase/epimerase family protein [Egibacteraceae bacterium]